MITNFCIKSVTKDFLFLHVEQFDYNSELGNTISIRVTPKLLQLLADRIDAWQKDNDPEFCREVKNDNSKAH